MFFLVYSLKKENIININKQKNADIFEILFQNNMIEILFLMIELIELGFTSTRLWWSFNFFSKLFV